MGTRRWTTADGRSATNARTTYGWHAATYGSTRPTRHEAYALATWNAHGLLHGPTRYASAVNDASSTANAITYVAAYATAHGRHASVVNGRSTPHVNAITRNGPAAVTHATAADGRNASATKHDGRHAAAWHEHRNALTVDGRHASAEHGNALTVDGRHASAEHGNALIANDGLT
jgi:hypothetical protein